MQNTQGRSYDIIIMDAKAETNSGDRGMWNGHSTCPGEIFPDGNVKAILSDLALPRERLPWLPLRGAAERQRS